MLDKIRKNQTIANYQIETLRSMLKGTVVESRRQTGGIAASRRLLLRKAFHKGDDLCPCCTTARAPSKMATDVGAYAKLTVVALHPRFPTW